MLNRNGLWVLLVYVINSIAYSNWIRELAVCELMLGKTESFVRSMILERFDIKKWSQCMMYWGVFDIKSLIWIIVISI